MYRKEIYEFIISFEGLILLNLIWGWGVALVINVVVPLIIYFSLGIIELIYKGKHLYKAIELFETTSNFTSDKISLKFRKLIIGLGLIGIPSSIAKIESIEGSIISYSHALVLVFGSAAIYVGALNLRDWITEKIMKYLIDMYDRIRRQQAKKEAEQENKEIE
jgi:hypothetical protein